MDLEYINSKIRHCKQCSLYKYKTNYVPGEGNHNSNVIFIGEAPGREEDRLGRPFVGKAGKYLTDVIYKKLGLKREDVFITNLLKCRPPNNRDPKPNEIKACSIWLELQLNIIKPSIIVTLGRHSSKWIFNYFGLKFSSIMKVRGKVYTVDKWGKTVYIIPTLHPASVLYHKEWKNLFESDFDLIKSLLEKTPKKSILDYLKKDPNSNN